MNVENMGYDVVGVRLPNGKVEVLKNRNGAKGEVFENDQQFYDKFRPLNEGASKTSVLILDMVNE